MFGFLDERELLGAMQGIDSGDGDSIFSHEPPFDFGDGDAELDGIFQSGVVWELLPMRLDEDDLADAAAGGAAGGARGGGAAPGGGRPGGGGRAGVRRVQGRDGAGGARHAAALRAFLPRGVHWAVARHTELVPGVPVRAAH